MREGAGVQEAGLRHVPVMLEETLSMLKCRPGGTYIDCTLGGGGHAAGILERIGPDGLLVGIDRDEEALTFAKERLRGYGQRFMVVHDNFVNIKVIVSNLGLGRIDGVVFDLGASSFQLDREERGFTYKQPVPLDMRMNTRQTVTAQELINALPERELTRIMREYGEERWASRIAKFIVQRRARNPIETAQDLVDIVKAAIPAGARRTGPHPARRIFQAFRIAVNDELNSFDQALRAAIDVLASGGRVVTITFHSLEDRIAKHTFRELGAGCRCPKDFPQCVCGLNPVVRIVTAKPVLPPEDEVARNPRARSAKLRAAEKF